MHTYFSKLEWNAKVCTSFFPFWAIPFTFYMFYLSLYLKEAGITDLQIGNIMVASNIAALISSFIASPLVDRLGRKWATLLFDLASSVLPAILFLVWPIYEVALVAMILTGLNRVMSVGYYLLMIEDSSEENSVVSVNLFNLILVASGLLTPIAGIFVVQLGVVKTEQVLLALAAFSMASQALLRHGLIHETPTGIQVRKKSQEDGRFWVFSRFFESYKKVFAVIKEDPGIIRAMGINAIIYVYFTLGTTSSLLFTPFFIDFVRIAPSQVGVIGGIYSIGTLTAMVLINPRMKRNNLYSYAIWASVLSIIAFIGLYLCPKGRFLFPALAVVFISLSYGILKTLADALLAVETHGEHRSGIYAASYLGSSLLGIVFIKITSMLYAHNPGWLLIMCGMLLGGVLLLSFKRKVVRR